MKRILTVAAVVGLLSFGVLAPTASAVSTFATNEADNGSVTLAKDQTKDGSYYASAQTVTVDGTVNGDVYCAGQDIFVNGTVNGDVLCAGQRVTIRGVVSGDVRTAGQMIEIAGTVGGSVSSFSQQTTIASGAIVKGNLNGGSQFVTVNGTVEKDVVIGAQELVVGGQVKGDVNAGVGRLVLASTPSVLGNLSYSSSRDLNVDKSRVAGAVTFTESKDVHYDSHSAAGSFAGLAFLMLLACIISSVVLSALVPRYYERSFALVNKKFGYAVLAGFLVLLAVPFVALILMMTGVLFPLGAMLLVASLLLHMLSFSFVAYYIGRWVFANVVRHSVLVMFAGAVILAIALMVPVLGVLVFIAVHILGTGGLVLTAINGYQKPTYKLPVKK